MGAQQHAGGGVEPTRGGEKAYHRWRGGSENDYQMSGGEAERGARAARKWGWCGGAEEFCAEGRGER